MRRAQKFRRRRIALLVGCACLAATATQRAAAQQDPAAAAEVDPAATPPTAAPEPDAAAAPSGGGWRIPPIVTSGALAYDLRMGRGPGDIRSTEHLVTTTFNAASYLYQPWFARISGSLGLTLSRADTRGEELGPLNQEGSRDRFTTGSVRLDLFPRSRFPFEVHYEVNDSRIDSGAPGTFDYRTRTFGIAQKYRPIDGRYNWSASAERRIFDSAGAHDTIDSLLADFNTHWKHNELSLGGSHSRGRREQSDERSMFSSIVGRHHFAPGDALSIDTTVNWTSTDDEVRAFTNDISLLQWSSVGVWHPEGRPWTLTGGLRALVLEDQVSGAHSETYGATLGGTYEVNENLRLTGNGSFTGLHTGGDTSESTIGSVGASYQGDTIEFREFRYDWFGGTTLGVSQSGEQQERTLSGQVGHTLARTWQMGEQSALGMNLGQSLSGTKTQQEPESDIPGLPLTTKLLVHNASLSWNTGSADRNGFARASYSDSDEIGGANARFRLLNLQVSGTLQIDRHQALSGDLTLQWSRQRSSDTFDIDRGGTVPGVAVGNASRGGEISYRHTRLFDVPRLRFTSKLRLSQDVQDQPGVLALIPDRETRLWENRLDWNIGRLESQLVLRFSWIDGQRRSLLLWRIQRTFGQ